MSGPYGVTPTGFVLKPLTQIASDTRADFLGLIDPDTDVSPDQPTGQTIDIVASRMSELWALVQIAYNATNRGDAEGDLLDNIGSLTGTLREGESPSTVPCDAVFSVAGTYAKGALVAFLAPPASAIYRFSNVDPIVVPALGDDGNPIGVGHPYTAKSQLFASTINGPDAGDALVAANIAAGGHRLTQKVPVAGWVSIADAGNVSIGALEEDEAPYRLRQYQDLSASGSDTIDATQADLLVALQNAGIKGASVQMYENTTMAFDPATGLPPKSYMAVVYDGDPVGQALLDNNALIGQVLWNDKPGGMQCFGTTTVLVADSQGVQRTVAFTRPTKIPVHLSLTVYVDPSMPAGVRATLQTTVAVAIVNAAQGIPFTLYGATFTPGPTAQTTLVPGVDFVASQFKSIAQGQAGVIDVQNFLVTAPTPTADGNVFVDINHLGAIAQGDITVNVANFVPAN